MVVAMGILRDSTTKENMIRLKLVGARNLEGLAASGRLEIKSLLLLMYFNFIL